MSSGILAEALPSPMRTYLYSLPKDVHTMNQTMKAAVACSTIFLGVENKKRGDSKLQIRNGEDSNVKMGVLHSFNESIIHHTQHLLKPV